MCAGIAHNNIDAAKSMGDTADQKGNVFGLAEIGHKTLGTRRTDRRHSCIETAFIASTNRNHAAFGRELLGGGKPYAACPPGD